MSEYTLIALLCLSVSVICLWMIVDSILARLDKLERRTDSGSPRRI